MPHSAPRFAHVAEALLFALIYPLPIASPAQSTPAPSPSFISLAPIALDTSGPVIRAHTEPLKPFTVAGEHGVLVGQQDGVFESWILPVKLLSHLTIEADVEGYGVPIDVNQQSSAIEVRPDRTILTYSHPTFTVRQIMLSPGNVPTGTTNSQSGPRTGPIVLFQFDCLHSTNFTFRFTPELRWMWPERNEGAPSPEWVSPDPHNPTAAGGFYVLHTDYPNLAGALTIPGAQPGILAPYQERPQVHPVELKLHIDPIRDHGRLFPLLMAAGMNTTAATNAALGTMLAQLNASIPALYQTHADAYKKLLADSVSIETPDTALNDAFEWAVVSIEQLKTPTIQGQSSPPTEQCHPERSTPGAPCDAWGKRSEGSAFVSSTAGGSPAPEETALVAGYFTSADSARPGFGWFFGRDALYTLYAVNGYGDFALAKSELEFLIHRQRADGKIMHEYSQTAAAIDWQSFPYMYAAADSTPLFLLAVADYVRSSGDTAFLTEHRDAIEKAWAFETDPAHDTDHDGIYDNSQGTGWVESWPGGMPHQEIYLALLDQQASAAVAYIEDLLKDSAKSAEAQQRANKIARTINTEYYDSQKSCYAFATNPVGSPNSPTDRTTTIYPALAWWDPANQKSILDHPEACLQQFAASALNTDWGTRDVANTEKIYDGLSYHQGSVWPLFTGWAALAEYRANQPLAGYRLLMENANLTWAQDLGADTELLSGDFYVPFGRSTSHQLWSSAMVITPTLRGLFGIAIDAQSKTITVNPHLPASWDHAAIHNLPLPNGERGSEETLSFERNGTVLEVSLSDTHLAGFRLRSDLPSATSAQLPNGSIGIRIALPLLGISAPFTPPLPGARTENTRILSETWGPNSVTLLFEGKAGATSSFEILRHSLLPRLKLESPQNKSINPNDPAAAPQQAASISMDEAGAQDPSVPINLTLHFPPSSSRGSNPAWQTLTVTLTW
jgi:glycogen debranching enzyme